MKLLTMNPFVIIKEEFSEATTIQEKILVIAVTSWAAMLSGLVVAGVGKLLWEAIYNPSTYTNATFGVFDTLG